MTKTTQIGPGKKIREKNSGAHSGGATECVSRLKGTPISCNLEGASLIRTNPYQSSFVRACMHVPATRIQERDNAGRHLIKMWSDFAALLWHFMWSSNTTLLHIPKTGGSSLEMRDKTSAAMHFRMQSYFLYEHDEALRDRSFANRCLCRKEDQCSLWHVPPSVLASCGYPPALNPYIASAAPSGMPAAASDGSLAPGMVYCVVREPLERWISAFFYHERLAAQLATPLAPPKRPGSQGPLEPPPLDGWRSWTKWRRRCHYRNDSAALPSATGAAASVPRAGLHRDPLLAGVSSLRSMQRGSALHNASLLSLLSCFASYTAHVQATATRQRGWLWMMDTQLHLLPQSRYVFGEHGELTCHHAFTMSDVGASLGGKPRASGSGQADPATSKLARQLVQAALNEQKVVWATELAHHLEADTRLWQRVEARQPLASGHAPLSLTVERVRARWPALFGVSSLLTSNQTPGQTPELRSSLKPSCGHVDASNGVKAASSSTASASAAASSSTASASAAALLTGCTCSACCHELLALDWDRCVHCLPSCLRRTHSVTGIHTYVHACAIGVSTASSTHRNAVGQGHSQPCHCRGRSTSHARRHSLTPTTGLSSLSRCRATYATPAAFLTAGTRGWLRGERRCETERRGKRRG